jgi:hypothetical protein
MLCLNTRTSMIKTNVLSMLLLFRDNCGKATTVRQKPVCTTATTMAPVHLPVNANATKHGWATVAKLVPARTPATVRSVFFNSQSPPPILPINPTDQSHRSLLPINPADYFHRSILPILLINPSDHFHRPIRSILPINPTDPTELLVDTRDE